LQGATGASESYENNHAQWKKMEPATDITEKSPATVVLIAVRSFTKIL